MLERIPTVATPQELLDRAFQRANKLEIYDPVRYHRIRKTELAKMQSVCDTIQHALQRLHDSFPNLESMRDYQQELLDIVIGVPALKKALGSIGWSAQKIRDVAANKTKDMAKVRDVDGVKRVQNSCYGRVADIVKSVEKDLALLAFTRDSIRILPTISPDYETVVIAGFPNVGKSSLLAELTRARPEIADYSFTTKSANVGHFEIKDKYDVATRYQVVDTPGLLDRIDPERNKVERQAIAALRHTADAVLFLIDPHSDKYTVEIQEHLLAQVKSEMSGLPFIVAETKLDLGDSGSDRVKFSTTTKAGVKDLMRLMVKTLLFEDLDLGEDPLDRWFKPDHVEEWNAL